MLPAIANSLTAPFRYYETSFNSYFAAATTTATATYYISSTRYVYTRYQVPLLVALPHRGFVRPSRSIGSALAGQNGGDAGEQERQQQGGQLVRAADGTGTSAGKGRNTGTPDEEGAITPAQHNPPACWHMKGRLTNTATGQIIALVEGVELSRSLAFETAAGGRERRGVKQGKHGELTRSNPGGEAAAAAADREELEVDKALKPGMWTAFGALASSKFFMYQVRRVPRPPSLRVLCRLRTTVVCALFAPRPPLHAAVSVARNRSSTSPPHYRRSCFRVGVQTYSLVYFPPQICLR